MAQRGHGRPEVIPATHHDLSRPLREVRQPARATPGEKHEKPLRKLPPRGPAKQPDPVIQSTASPLIGTTSASNFLGLGADFVGPDGAFSVDAAPSDSNGAAGATQYVQWVNTSFAVFDKQTGAPIYGPVTGDTLWAGFGGPCEANNDGDPIVKYDRAAGRWIFSQLAATGGPPFYQCVAVSTGADATGTYQRYSYQFSDLNDYPKFAVWPDAYYFTFNIFQGTTFQGAKACAMDRSEMLAGGPATAQCFQLAPNFGGILPSDLDGFTAPPAGSPNFLVGYTPETTLNLFQFHVDFANPANSTLTGPAALTVANFTEACNGGGACIPQLGTSQQLDSVGDRPMYRLAYRNFGDHEAMVLNHSVTAGPVVGVRWYEIRSPGTTPVVYQQGTYAPDSAYRWMGSMAMDKIGNIALGYSVSSSAMHPAIRYTGREPSDPLGTLQAENSIIEGSGSQLPQFVFSFSRWGDYSSLAVDPDDDCTFWYTNQYLNTDGNFNWSTRIASFSFPSCLATPPPQDFFLTATPGTQNVAQGSSTNFSVTVTPIGGFGGSVSFSASGLPAGATASFNPATLSGSGSTTLTITTASTTPGGSFPVTITSASGVLSHSAIVTLVVYAPAAVTFVKLDASTQGTWKGSYGADGYAIANDSTNYPAYAQVSFTGANLFTWAGSTTDVRALQKGASANRIASAWYSTTSFLTDLNLTDGNQHQVAIYCLDWDSNQRSQTVEVLDAVSGAVLDTRSLSSFNAGRYLAWNITGHVKIRVTRLAGFNAVINGLFLDPPATTDFLIAASPSSQSVGRGSSATTTVSITPLLGFNGTVGFAAAGLPAGAVASFNPATVAGSGSTTLTITTAANTPFGSYPITITGTSGALSHFVNFNLTVFSSATAVFARFDSSTQGTWKGVYGSNGYAIVNDSTSYPAYAQVSVTGASPYTWASSTTDLRALQRAASSNRIASAWYSSTNFIVDINLNDGNTHQIAAYGLDWDRTGRAQTVEVLDATSGNVLDTRSVSAFGGGQYLIWNVAGHVKIRATRTGGPNAVINGLFFDPAGALVPDFSLTATPSSQTVAPGANAPYSVTVSSTGGFGGSVNFGVTGLPSGASASFNPPAVTGSGSSTLTVTAGAGTPVGNYPLTLSATSGALSHSASVTFAVFVPATAVFLKTDSTAQGNWKTVYGANGWAIPNDSTSYPAYAQVSLTGASLYTWASSTTDVRALQKAASSDRIASAWYSSSNFIVDINLSDGNTHQIGAYYVDWERAGRVQTVDVLDAVTGTVLDTRSVSGFSGQYLLWNLSGHVKIRATRVAGPNALINGLFFDVAGAAVPDFSLTVTPSSQVVARAASTSYTVTISPAGGFSGSVALSASGLPSGAVASFNPASVNGSGSSTMTVTTASATPSGTYNPTISGSSGSLHHSASVALVVSAPAPAAASFVKTDAVTQGTWKGAYGAAGFAIPADFSSYPPYAQVNVSNQGTFTWQSSTNDVRALQKAFASDRLASTWYSSTSFNVDLNLVDAMPHSVEIYCLDWENAGRVQTIEVRDAATSAVLDTRTLSGFSGGQWVVWNLTGHVQIRVTRTAGPNAVINGLFFDTGP